jgi:hypothetical protein
MTPPSDEYKQFITHVNSNMCRGCTKIALREGKILCYLSDNSIGLWNDLLNGWHCSYRHQVMGGKHER